MEREFSRRAAAQQQRVFGYFKYIFNDHFVIALFFLAGALAFQYAQWLETLAETGVAWWHGLLWALVMTALLWFGRVATFMTDADRLFLLPAEHALDAYMRRALRYSLWLPFAFVLAGLFISQPLLAIARDGTLPVPDFVVLIATTLVMKAADLVVQMAGFRFGARPFAWRLLLSLVNLIGFGTFFLTYSYIYPLLAVLTLAGVWFILRPFHSEQRWDLQRLIEKETARQQQVNALLGLFVEVKGQRATVKRRRWADGLLTKRADDPFAYLYERAFWRTDDWLGLWVRFSLLTILVVWVLPVHWLSGAVVALLLFVNALQLLPLSARNQTHPLLLIAPLEQMARKQGFVRFLRKPLTISALGVIVSLIGHFYHDPAFLFAMILVTIAVTGAILWGYVPRRVNKRRARG